MQSSKLITEIPVWRQRRDNVSRKWKYSEHINVSFLLLILGKQLAVEKFIWFSGNF